MKQGRDFFSALFFYLNNASTIWDSISADCPNFSQWIFFREIRRLKNLPRICFGFREVFPQLHFLELNPARLYNVMPAAAETLSDSTRGSIGMRTCNVAASVMA